jgi:hypothetical protein
MATIKFLIWKTNDGTGDPDVEVRIPSAMARWVPRMMAFVPRKSREEIWGEDADFKSMFSNIDQLVAEAVASGLSEVAEVKTKEGRMKIVLEKD